jgi:hypothetical protein
VHGSKYITLSKKARKFLKGKEILLKSQNYITGDGTLKSQNRQLDIFLLSRHYLDHAQLEPKKTTRHQRMFQQRNQFCRCRKIRKNFENQNTKFLITARTLPAKNFYYNRNGEFSNEDIKVINRKSKMLYLTHVITWQRAKQLVRFIDQDFNITMLCKNKTIIFN